jgi:hypothetical protein
MNLPVIDAPRDFPRRIIASSNGKVTIPSSPRNKIPQKSHPRLAVRAKSSGPMNFLPTIQDSL